MRPLRRNTGASWSRMRPTRLPSSKTRSCCRRPSKPTDGRIGMGGRPQSGLERGRRGRYGRLIGGRALAAERSAEPPALPRIIERSRFYRGCCFREVLMHSRHWLAVLLTAAVSMPFAAVAAEPIKIGFPIPLSGPTAVYGEPILKGAELAVAEISAKGGVLGRKIELISRDSKANADEAVRLAREFIIKDNVDFLVGTLTSAETPAVSTVAKENKIVFVAPTSETTMLTDPQHIHPYIFRATSNTDVEGLAAAMMMARWKDVKTVA